MTDERPSAFYGTSSLGPTLLGAGRDERPSDEALARTLAAVGAGAAVIAVASGVAGAGLSAGTAAKGGAALVSFGSVVKWLGMGALGGVVVAGVAHGITPPQGPRFEMSSSVGVALSPIAPPAARPELPPKAAAAASAETDRGEAPKAAPPPRAAPPSLDDAEEGGVPLAAEVALVDRARAALGSGKPGHALDELRGYEAAFPEPRLLPEVLYLRLEAHLAAGDAARARSVAEQSIRRFPRSPHAARARQVLEGNVDEKK
jgi:hypothetical protein